MAPTAMSAQVVPVGEGRPIDGLGAIVGVSSDALAGTLFVFEAVLPPGAFIPPHTHAREDEVTYVVEGELVFDLGGRTSSASSGAFIVKPRGIYHSFWNACDTPARAVEIHAPALLEPYYDELGALFSAPDRADFDVALTELQGRFGIVTHPELIAGLVNRHGAGSHG